MLFGFGYWQSRQILFFIFLFFFLCFGQHLLGTWTGRHFCRYVQVFFFQILYNRWTKKLYKIYYFKNEIWVFAVFFSPQSPFFGTFQLFTASFSLCIFTVIMNGTQFRWLINANTVWRVFWFFLWSCIGHFSFGFIGIIVVIIIVIDW